MFSLSSKPPSYGRPAEANRVDLKHNFSGSWFCSYMPFFLIFIVILCFFFCTISWFYLRVKWLGLGFFFSVKVIALNRITQELLKQNGLENRVLVNNVNSSLH